MKKFNVSVRTPSNQVEQVSVQADNFDVRGGHLYVFNETTKVVDNKEWPHEGNVAVFAEGCWVNLREEKNNGTDNQRES